MGVSCCARGRRSRARWGGRVGGSFGRGVTDRSNSLRFSKLFPNRGTMVQPTTRKSIHLEPNGGRVYAMGPIKAVFKADGTETRGRYAISEWWLEPKTKGPGVHSHPDDDVFY